MYQPTISCAPSGQRGSAAPSNARISNHSQSPAGVVTVNQPSGDVKVCPLRYCAGSGAMPFGVAPMSRNASAATRDRTRIEAQSARRARKAVSAVTLLFTHLVHRAPGGDVHSIHEQRRFVMKLVNVCIVIALTIAISAHAVPTAAKKPVIQVAILLDTSNSMDGLIDQARTQLWRVVNEFATAKKNGIAPDLYVALYEYGNSGLSAEKGYIRDR